VLGFGIAAAIFPQYLAAAKAVVPWMVGVLLAVKAVVALLMLRSLVNSTVLSNESIAAMLATWIFVVAALSTTVIWLAPAGAATTRDILAGIILLIPFSRLAGAPLAVEWNRHR
jgi:hypothetical protein